MSFLAEIDLEDPPLFTEFADVVPDATATIENFHHFTDGPNDHYALFWWIETVDPDAFERATREHPAVCELRMLASVEGRRFYRMTTNALPEETMLFPHFRRHDVSVLDNEGSADGLWLRVRVPDRETLKRLVGELRTLGSTVSVERIYVEGTPDRSGTNLTDRQRECLSLAFQRGYFETPSRATLQDLAGDLDVTPQTLSKHIRAAVRKLVARELSNDTDGVADASVSGPT